MKVKELIKLLQQQDQEQDIGVTDNNSDILECFGVYCLEQEIEGYEGWKKGTVLIEASW